MSECSYCKQIVKAGGLYCSRNTNLSDMAKVDSGIHVIRAREIETHEPHVTRLSLNFDLTGAMGFEVGKKKYTVRPERFLVMNAGSAYRSFLRSEVAHHTAYIVFKVGLAEQVYKTMTTRNIGLLDDPYSQLNTNISFTEKMYTWNRTVLSDVITILADIEAGVRFHGDELDAFYESLLSKMIAGQFEVDAQMASLKFEKQATRNEIFLRLDVARDFIHDNYASNITLADVSNAACLSLHHFKRLFRECYKISPHQYLTDVRLQHAVALLQRSDTPVQDVCRYVGFSDPSSFVRLFKSRMAVTPQQYREKVQR